MCVSHYVGQMTTWVVGASLMTAHSLYLVRNELWLLNMTNIPSDADNRRRMPHAAREMVADVHKLIPLPDPCRPCSRLSLSIRDRVSGKYDVSRIDNFDI